MLLAIDPGLRHCGYAVFYGGRLVAAGLVRSPDHDNRGPVAWLAMATAVVDELDRQKLPMESGDELVLEGQQVYQTGKLAGKMGADANDLLELSGVCGALAALYAGLTVQDFRRVMPAQWKGTTDKAICQLRVSKRLSDSEAMAISWPGKAGKDSSLAHNVYDAIAIGLWAVGRWR